MHWLSYSHADQALFRDPDVEFSWDALVVPGTLAAFYFDGTGGFVLSRGRPYVIDPRTPLLQYIDVARPEPRKSHLELARIHDPEVPGVWPDREISLEHWQDGRWPDVVKSVLDFQETYADKATKKFGKYDQLLRDAGRGRPPGSPKPPLRFVPPYWAVTGSSDPWWDLTLEAIEIAVDRFGDQVQPILAMTRDTPVSTLASLISEVPDSCTEVFGWRGDWDESSATREDVRGWSTAIDAADSVGVELTNLYGGYLSVLLTGAGLRGVSHGVGYSEKRDVRRLGSTGGAPARYYVPALRHHASQAQAQPLLDSLPVESMCTCQECERVKEDGVPIVGRLGTEALKRHFLICRGRELQRVAHDLDAELADLRTVVDYLASSRNLSLAGDYGSTLESWADFVSELL